MNGVVKCLGAVSVVAVLCSTAAASATAATGHAAAETTSKVGVLSVSYPARFAHLDFNPSRGVLVADYPLSRNGPAVRTGVFSPSGVVLEVSREPKLQPPIAAPTVRFPLSLGRLGRIAGRPNGQTWELRFRVQGGVYWVIVWFGKSSSEEDRAAIASVVSSIRSG
jgi:hypothetical protein